MDEEVTTVSYDDYAPSYVWREAVDTIVRARPFMALDDAFAHADKITEAYKQRFLSSRGAEVLELVKQGERV